MITASVMKELMSLLTRKLMISLEVLYMVTYTFTPLKSQIIFDMKLIQPPEKIM